MPHVTNYPDYQMSSEGEVFRTVVSRDGESWFPERVTIPQTDGIVILDGRPLPVADLFAHTFPGTPVPFAVIPPLGSEPLPSSAAPIPEPPSNPVPLMDHVAVSEDRRVWATVDGVRHELTPYLTVFHGRAGSRRHTREQWCVIVPPATGYRRDGTLRWKPVAFTQGAFRPCRHPVEKLYNEAYGVKTPRGRPKRPHPSGRLPAFGQWAGWYAVDRHGRVYEARLAPAQAVELDGVKDYVRNPNGSFRQMTPTPDEFGRPTVTLRRPLFGKRRDFVRTYLVAEVIAKTFLGVPETASQIVYLDGDPTNVAAENLVWKPQPTIKELERGKWV